MKKNWIVKQSSSGAQVSVYAYRPSTRAILALEAAVDRADRLVGHALCSSGLPEVFWRVPLGLPRKDPEDPTRIANSVAEKAYDLFNGFSGLVYRLEERDRVASFPVAKEDLARLAPSWEENFGPAEDPEESRPQS